MKSRTAKIFNFSSIFFPSLSILSLSLHIPSLSITLFTISYHLIERMLSGVVSAVIKVDGSSPYYRIRDWEIKLYKRIKVKEWKAFAPTYNPDSFHVDDLTLLRKSMLGSERCHIFCFIWSYLPPIVSLIIPYLNSSFYIFLITSIISSLLDLSLIAIQRFNRNRVERIIEIHHIK